MQIAAFYTVAFSCRIAALSLATQCMPLCYLGCSQALPTVVRKPLSAQQVCPTPLHKSGSAATANFCTVQTAGFERSKQGINKQKPEPTHCVATREALCCHQRGRAVQLHSTLYNGGPPILEAHTCAHGATATHARTNRYPRMDKLFRADEQITPSAQKKRIVRTNEHHHQYDRV